MITAVDTSVLLDIFGADPVFGVPSREALRTATSEGRLVVCDVVWSEIAASFPSAKAARAAMQLVGVDFDPLTEDAAALAGEVFRKYRARGGKRQRVVADFLVGAHAISAADRLLTRDRGFYRSYFGRLRVLDPSP